MPTCTRCEVARFGGPTRGAERLEGNLVTLTRFLFADAHHSHAHAVLHKRPCRWLQAVQFGELDADVTQQ